MPLLKRKPFALEQQPPDLNPDELVFQIRFTKEIFRDYHISFTQSREYLNRINLYRQRVWTCNVTGKMNLTFEEALVSERHAINKVQQFPKELTGPSAASDIPLFNIMAGTLRLKDLLNTIFTRLQDHLLEGEELYGKKEQSVCPCRILRVLEKETDSVRYEVGWLDRNKTITDTSMVNACDLIRRKLPFSRNLLKSFVRDSTSQSAPWIVRDKLARKHGILTDPPEGLRNKISENRQLDGKKAKRENKAAENGEVLMGKRKKHESMSTDVSETVRKKGKQGTRKNLCSPFWVFVAFDSASKLYPLYFDCKSEKFFDVAEDERPKEEPIKYPIDDLLVKPGPDDPVFSDRPSPARDFRVPMDSFGDLLMIWDFCSSFSRLLHLWPFSLEDFENAVCHKDSDLILIAETHSAILRLLLKDKGDYFMATQKKRQKRKITLMNWTEYLCDFLEMKDIPELSGCIGTIKRGHYGLLDPHVKLRILREVVSQVFSTNAVREQLDEYIEQQHENAARKREEALEEARKEKEEQHSKETVSETKVEVQGDLENRVSIPFNNRDVSGEGNEENFLDKRKKASAIGGTNHTTSGSRKSSVNQLGGPSNLVDHRNAQRKRKDKDAETRGKNTKDQRKENPMQEIERQFIRTNPLGKDRNYNRYWFFRRDGRIFIESSDSRQWGYYSTKEEVTILETTETIFVDLLTGILFFFFPPDQLDVFVGSLNPKGVRERALGKQLEKYYSRICFAFQKRSRDISHRIAQEHAVLRRSTRVRAQPRDSPAAAFLRYMNKWKED
ncbi:hypothetical protein ACLOJK_017020 [Asimina triloba]